MSRFDKLNKILSSITGVSTAVLGVNWEPSKNEREVLYKFIIKMNNRRLLSRTHSGFWYKDSLDSLNIIRENITNALIELGPDSKYEEILITLINYYKIFQTTIETEFKNNDFRDDIPPSNNLIEEWSNIKAKGGLILGTICYACDIETPHELLVSYNIPEELKSENGGNNKNT